VRPEGLGKLEKFDNLMGSRTRDLPVCIILSQATTLPHTPYKENHGIYHMPLLPSAGHAGLKTARFFTDNKFGVNISLYTVCVPFRTEAVANELIGWTQGRNE
jgi:hypothetical protein